MTETATTKFQRGDRVRYRDGHLWHDIGGGRITDFYIEQGSEGLAIIDWDPGVQIRNPDGKDINSYPPTQVTIANLEADVPRGGQVALLKATGQEVQVVSRKGQGDDIQIAVLLWVRPKDLDSYSPTS